MLPFEKSPDTLYAYWDSFFFQNGGFTLFLCSIVRP